MKINTFEISQDKKTLSLQIEDATNVNSLHLWTDKTFKDFSKSINLYDKLTGSANEDITITLSDIGETVFDGIYFIEAKDDNEIDLQYTYDLTRYKECILDEIMYLYSCDDCLDETSTTLINSHSVLKGLEYALEARLINEIITLSSTLNKFCKNNCKSCGEVKAIETTDSEENFVINVKVDGKNI